MDADEKFVIAATFDMASPFHDGRAQVLKGDKWGLIDRTGKSLAEPRYSYIAPFIGGWAPVAGGGQQVEGGLAGSKWGLIDASGRVLLKPNYDMVYLLDKENALVNQGGRWRGAYGSTLVGGKWGLVDRRGRFVIEPSITLPTRFDLFAPPGAYPEDTELGVALLFGHGLAPVAIDGKWGYIDDQYRTAIKPRFDWAGPFAVPPPLDTYWGAEPHKYGGAVVRKADNPTPLARARLGGKFGFVDRTGAWAIPPRYDEVGHFSGGLAWARRGERLAFVNEKGVEVFAVEKGEKAESFWNGLAPVRVGDRWGFVNRAGRWVHEPQFDEIRPLTDSLRIVGKDRKYGLINHAGKFVCPVEYDWISELGDTGLAIVQSGDDRYESRSGVINKSGRFLLQPVAGRDFSTVNAKCQSDQTIFPRRKGQLWGFVDRAGEFVIEPQFESLEARGDGMIAVRLKRQTGLVDVRAGRLVCPPRYDSIDEFSEGLAVARPEFLGKSGYIDRAGKVVIPATWYSAGPFRDGVAVVYLSRPGDPPRQLWIDRSGRYLWAPPAE
jgi:hypothetical protein